MRLPGLFTKLLCFSLLLAFPLLGQTLSPVVFYSDLQSGPSTGGPNNKGTIVTIYGRGFGSTRGSSTVTIGGVPTDTYLRWSDNKISIQVGNGAVSGKVVVNVGGTASTGTANFTVRSGKLYFVSTSGSDSGSGSYTAPWRTLAKAKSKMVAGDTVYVRGGYAASSIDSSASALYLTKSGTSSAPMAIVAYPGESATIGSTTATTYGVNGASGVSNWVIAGLTLRGSLTAADVNGSRWRLVANDMSCPNAASAGACLAAEQASNLNAYGNKIHDSGPSGGYKLYHGVAFMDGSNNVDFGWNEVANSRGCRAVQFYSDSASLYAIKVHDNLIHDAVCDGINFGNVDASQGTVRAYNNVIYRVGTGPAPGGSEANYACINANGASTVGTTLSNNTMYDCGRRGGSDAGAISTGIPMLVVGNILYANTGESYIAPATSSANLSGNNNLFYGVGSAPSVFTSSVNADPMFVDPANADFHLQSGSPAIDKSVTTIAKTDFDGIARPQGAAYDIGAFERSSGSSPTPVPSGTLSATPTSLTFGSVQVGSSTSSSISITNTGSASATISSINSSTSVFTTSGITLPMTLAAGQSATLNVKFAPTTTGSATGTITVASDATNPSLTISVSGTGATAGTLSASPTSVAFGSIAVGSSSSATVKLTNNTASSVSITAANVTGTGFSVSGQTFPVSLAAGASASFTVQFTPSTAGTFSGSVSFANSTNTAVSVSLSGTGATAIAHSVTVSWTASTSTVSGYNVYRSGTSGGPYQKVNTSLVTGTSFTDTTVIAGQTFYYVVTAVNSSGTESVNSTEASATVPSP